MTTITLRQDDLDHLRHLLRDALTSEYELLGEIREGLASRFSVDDVLDSIATVNRLAESVGGLY
jgi:hypothetical protein